MRMALPYRHFVSIQVFTGGAVPFSGIPSSTAMVSIVQAVRPPRPTHPTFTESLWTLMQRCWDHDSSLRPKVSEVLQILLTLSVLRSSHGHSSVDHFSLRSEDPAWKRLITHTPTTHERISLITTIFSDYNQAEMVKDLRGDDAQEFIDVLDEVSLRILSPPRNGYVNSNSNSRPLSVRCWTVFLHRSERSVRTPYAASVATEPWFRDHWQFHFVTTQIRTQ